MNCTLSIAPDSNPLMTSGEANFLEGNQSWGTFMLMVSQVTYKALGKRGIFCHFIDFRDILLFVGFKGIYVILKFVNILVFF